MRGGIPRVDLPLARVVDQETDRDTSPMAAPRVAKSLPYPSMAFWSPLGACDNIFVHARFITTQARTLDLKIVTITAYIVTQCL